MAEKETLFKTMMYGESDLVKTVSVQGDDWQIKPPLTYAEKNAIVVVRKAFMRGLSLEDLYASEYERYDQLATVQSCVKKYPEWFEKSFNKSFADLPDTGIVKELYEQILSFQEELEKKIQSGEFGKSSP